MSPLAAREGLALAFTVLMALAIAYGVYTGDWLPTMAGAAASVAGTVGPAILIAVEER